MCVWRPPRTAADRRVVSAPPAPAAPAAARRYRAAREATGKTTGRGSKGDDDDAMLGKKKSGAAAAAESAAAASQERTRAQFNDPDVLPPVTRVPYNKNEAVHVSNPRRALFLENVRPLSRSERAPREDPWGAYAQQVDRGIVSGKVYEQTPSELHHLEMLTSINEFIGGADRKQAAVFTEVNDEKGEVVRAIY